MLDSFGIFPVKIHSLSYPFLYYLWFLRDRWLWVCRVRYSSAVAFCMFLVNPSILIIRRLPVVRCTRCTRRPHVEVIRCLVAYARVYLFGGRRHLCRAECKLWYLSRLRHYLFTVPSTDYGQIISVRHLSVAIVGFPVYRHRIAVWTNKQSERWTSGNIVGRSYGDISGYQGDRWLYHYIIIIVNIIIYLLDDIVIFPILFVPILLIISMYIN